MFFHHVWYQRNMQASKHLRTNCISSPPVCLRFCPSLTPLLVPQSLPVSEEDLMNISLWVEECKTNTSLDLLSPFVCFLGGRMWDALKRLRDRGAHTLFWHLHCLLSSHLILSSPLIISNSMAQMNSREVDVRVAAGASLPPKSRFL